METAIDGSAEPEVARDESESGDSGGAAHTAAALVERARRGDSEAFEKLYREHHRGVLALALRLTGDAARAESLTQDAFVRAWRGLARFRGDSRLATWLHAITVRAHVARRRADRRALRRETEAEYVADYAQEARRAMPGTDIDLERAVARLPAGAREVLVLHDIHGYKHREIGDLLGIAPGTSKAQLHRARKLVRSHLEAGRRDDARGSGR